MRGAEIHKLLGSRRDRASLLHRSLQVRIVVVLDRHDDFFAIAADLEVDQAAVNTRNLSDSDLRHLHHLPITKERHRAMLAVGIRRQVCTALQAVDVEQVFEKSWIRDT